MNPFLFRGTQFEVPTYFVAYLLAFLGAIIMATYKARRDGLSPVRAVDTGMMAFVGGVSGARLFHILIEAPEYYWEKPLRVFYFWQGGFVLYGGLILGTLACFAFLKYLKEPVARWADVAAPCILLGLAIGRLGCLAAGCCYGKPTLLAWGMIFNDPRSGAPLHIALHPTQALESVFCFAAAAIFYRIFRGPPRRSGTAFVWMSLIYSVFRFGIEFLRGDLDRGLYLKNQLSTSQFISIAVLVGCVIWLARKPKESSRVG